MLSVSEFYCIILVRSCQSQKVFREQRVQFVPLS